MNSDLLNSQEEKKNDDDVSNDANIGNLKLLIQEPLPYLENRSNNFNDIFQSKISAQIV